MSFEYYPKRSAECIISAPVIANHLSTHSQPQLSIGTKSITQPRRLMCRSLHVVICKNSKDPRRIILQHQVNPTSLQIFLRTTSSAEKKGENMMCSFLPPTNTHSTPSYPHPSMAHVRISFICLSVPGYTHWAGLHRWGLGVEDVLRERTRIRLIENKSFIHCDRPTDRPTYIHKHKGVFAASRFKS